MESVVSPDFRLINSKGELMKRMGIEQTFSSWEAIYDRLRANFDGLTSSYVPEPPAKSKGEGVAKNSFGKTVTGLQGTRDGVSIEIQDQTGFIQTNSVDIVVAADGPSSTVRQMFVPESKRKYAGCSRWRGIVAGSGISVKTREILGEMTTFCQMDGSYIISSVPTQKPPPVSSTG